MLRWSFFARLEDDTNMRIQTIAALCAVHFLFYFCRMVDSGFFYMV